MLQEEALKRVTTHLADRDERRVVVGHKEVPPDGYYEKFVSFSFLALTFFRHCTV